MSGLASGVRLLSLGLFCACTLSVSTVAAVRLPFTSRSHVDRRELALGAWRLRVERGKFSRDVRCFLRDTSQRVVYASGALGFHFRHHPNTLGAWVSIDRGPPMRWQSFLPELTRLGVPMDGARLDNPNDSTVWIPAASLADANQVTIEPNEANAAKSFRLRGFAGLREIARTMGCVPEGRFLQ